MGNELAMDSRLSPHTQRRNMGIGKVLISVLALLIIGCLLAPFILTVQALPTPSGDYLVTNPSMSSYAYTTSKGNYLRLEVYGWQMDPSKEADLSYDYYFFHIWATSDAASNYCPTSSGVNDAYGPTMYVVASLAGATDEAFMTAYTTPTGYNYVPSARTLGFNFGYSQGGASIGLSWTQNVPQWESDTPTLTASEIDWRAAQADRVWSWNQAWAWGFTVGVRTPQGKGRCSLTASLTCNWFTGTLGIITGSDTQNIFVASVFQGWTRNTVNPNGGRIYVDGNLLTSSQTYAWQYTSNHNLDPDSGYSTGTGSRQIFTGWSDGSTADPRSVTVTGSATYTANWKNQYYLTVSSPYDTPYGQGWYDSGNAAYASLTTGTVSGGSGVQYVFTSWSGDASGTNYAQSNSIPMNQPRTANANWKTMYTLTVISNPSSIDNPRPSGWYDSGANVLVQCDTPVSGGTGIQYVFIQWSGDASGTSPTTTVNMNGPRTAIANYKHQYYLTVNSNPSGVDNPRTSGWYDDGSTQTVQCDSPVSGGTGVQYVFTQWSGDASGTGLSTSVFMNGPKTATANYQLITTTYTVTIAAQCSVDGSVGVAITEDGSPSGFTTPHAFTGVSGSHTFTVPGSDANGHPFSQWSTGATTITITVSSSGTYTAYYQPATSYKVYMVVRGNDNRVYYRIYSCNSASWGSWNVLPGATLDSPAAAVLNNKLCVVVRGLDGSSLWYGYVDLGTSSFSSWTLLSGATSSAPTLTSNGTTLCLVVRGLDNHIYYSCYSGSWNSWFVAGAGTTCDSPAAAMLGNDLHIVVRGMDGNSLWHTKVSCDGSDSAVWTQVSGATSSKPALSSQDSNTLCLVVRGLDNGIYYRTYIGSSDSWGSWSVLPGSTIDGPGQTVCNTQLYVAVRGSDGNSLWFWDGNNWNLINGSTPSAPTLTS